MDKAAWEVAWANYLAGDSAHDRERAQSRAELLQAMTDDVKLRAELLDDVALSARLRVVLAQDGEVFIGGMRQRLGLEREGSRVVRGVQLRLRRLRVRRRRSWSVGLAAALAASVVVALLLMLSGSHSSGPLEPQLAMRVVRVVDVHGVVTRRDGRALTVGAQLQAGDQLNSTPTADDQTAALVLDLGDGSSLRLSADARMEILAARHLRLDRGQIYAQIDHSTYGVSTLTSPALVIDTASASAVVTGTRFGLAVTDDATTLSLDQGSVLFRNAHGEQRVDTRHASRATPDQAPGAVYAITPEQIWRGGVDAPETGDGLVAVWHCDEPASDRLFDATGRFPATVVGTQRVPGVRGSALRLLGTEGQFASGTASLHLRQFTIALWMRSERSFSAMKTEHPALMTQNIPPPVPRPPGYIWRPRGFVFGQLNPRADTIGLRIGTGQEAYADYEVVAPAPEPGVWAHVAATFDGQDLRLFQDGRQVAHITKSGTEIADEAIDIEIGNNFEGDMDEIYLYRRVLTMQEIAALAKR